MDPRSRGDIWLLKGGPPTLLAVLDGGNNGQPETVTVVIVRPAGESEAAPTSLVVVQHFDEELKRLVPVE